MALLKYRFRYNNDEFCRVIAGERSPLRSRTEDPYVELILGNSQSAHNHTCISTNHTPGMVRSGATYLLMTTGQFAALRLSFPRARPRLSTDFESLSPIRFRNADEFSTKLATYKTKSRKGRGVATDNSQANKTFLLTPGDDGVARGAFEHGR